MCFGVISIKQFLNSCSLKNLSHMKNKGWQKSIYKLVCKYLWSYVNDAIRMKSFTKSLSKLKSRKVFFGRFFTLLSI